MISHIIDNFLTETYHKKILELLTGPNIDWKYNASVTGPYGRCAHPETPQINEYGFVHDFWHDQTRGGVSRFTPFIEPMMFQILDVANCDFFWRARADMVTWTGKETYIHPAHIDYPFPNTASIFYVNESDGDTILYNAKRTDVANYKDLKEYDRVSPKANRLVLFDGDLLHTGCSPTKHKQRILINSNYVKKEYIEEAEGFSGK